MAEVETGKRPKVNWDDFEDVTPKVDWADFEPAAAETAEKPADAFSRIAQGLAGPAPYDEERDREFLARTRERNGPEISPVQAVGTVMGRTGAAIPGVLADIGTLDPSFPNLRAAVAGRKQPIQTTMENIHTPGISFPYKVSAGLLETAPKVAAVAGAQAVGVPAPLAAGAVFGTTEQGFSPGQAAVAAALPFLGKYGGEIAGKVAQKLGVSNATALDAVKAAGSLVAAGGAVRGIDEVAIRKLPKDQQDAARVDAWANVVGQSLLGPMGVEFSKTYRGGEPAAVPPEVARAETISPQAAAATREALAETETAQPKEQNASDQQETAAVHGDLRAPTREGTEEVPAAEGGGGIQPQTGGGIPEAPQGEVLLKPEGTGPEARGIEKQTPANRAQEIAAWPADKPFVKGFTREAIEYGAGLKDPAQLEELRQLADATKQEFDAIPKDIEHFQQMSTVGLKKQWLNEAIQGATGEREELTKQLIPDYKPPFPEGEARPMLEPEASINDLVAKKAPVSADLVESNGLEKQMAEHGYQKQGDSYIAQNISPPAEAKAGKVPTPEPGPLLDVPRGAKPLVAERRQLQRILEKLDNPEAPLHDKVREAVEKRLADVEQQMRAAAGQRTPEPKPAPAPSVAAATPPAAPAPVSELPPRRFAPPIAEKFTLQNVDLPNAVDAASRGTPINKRLKIQREFLMQAVQDALKTAPAEKQLSKEQRKLIEQARDITAQHIKGSRYHEVRSATSDEMRSIIRKRLDAQETILRTEIRNTIPHVEIHVPGDGTFTLLHTRDALQEFGKTVRERFPTSITKPSPPGLARKTPTPTTKLGKGTIDDAVAALKDVPPDPEGRQASIDTIYGNGKELVATDGRMMIRLLLPGHGSQESPVEINPKTGEEKLWDYKQHGHFPPYDKVVPAKSKFVATVDAAQMAHMVKQAQLMTGEKSNTVVLHQNSDGSLGLSTNDPNTGMSEHNLKKGAQRMLAVHPEYLAKVLNAALRMGNDKVDLYATGSLSPLVIQGKNMQGVIMPLRLGEEKDIPIPEPVNKEALYKKPFPAGVTPEPPPEGRPVKKSRRKAPAEPGPEIGPGPGAATGGIAGEGAGLPTIEEQISGEPLAPERTRPEPEGREEPSVTGSMMKVAKGTWNEAKAWLAGTAGKMFPRTTQRGKNLGELASRWVSSRIAAKPVADVFAADVLGNSGVDPVKLGAALTEDNLRSIRDAFQERADEARNRDEIVEDLRGDLERLKDMDTDNPQIKQEMQDTRREIARISKLTDEDALRFDEQANQVKSFIGEKNFPFKDEDAYQAFLDDEKTKEAIERHKDLWKAVVEPQYKQAMSLDPQMELPSRGQQTGARINLRALTEDEPPMRDTVSSAGSGRLLNTLRRKSPFGVAAKGTGERYAVNYYDIMQNTFARQLEVANKNAFEEAMVKAGQAVVEKPGQDVMIHGQRAEEFPLRRRTLVFPGGAASAQNESIYINKPLAREYRIAANVDAKPPPFLVRGINKVLNTAAISAATDATTHLVNQFSTLAYLPGTSGGILKDTVLSAFPGRPDFWLTVGKAITKSFQDNRAQLASLAEIGALRDEHAPSGLSRVPPFSWFSKLIQSGDKNVRLSLDDAYKRMAESGLVENSETARREFVNQVGQYNKRAQGWFKRLFRDTGLGPFVTAGTTFNALGARSLLLRPGVESPNFKGSLALKVNMAAKIFGTYATVMTLNYLFTGKVGGRPGTPIGDIDTGKDDANGRPQIIPLFSMVGPGRGARVLGVRGFAEAKRQGLPTGTAIDSAARDIINSAISPWAGPPVKFAMTAASGYPPAVGVGRQTHVVAPGESQFAENLKEALMQASPITAGVMKAREPGSTGISEILKSQLPRLIPQPGKPPQMMQDYPAVVRRAQANAFMEDVIGRARKMEPQERMKFLQDSVLRLEDPGDRARAIRELKYRKVI